MGNKCEFCVEKCPQAERAHQTALGRMYATKEFIALLKKVESGKLVEVVRCKDCKRYCKSAIGSDDCLLLCVDVKPDDYCSHGERKDND